MTGTMMPPIPAMQMSLCPFCAREVPGTATVCAACGATRRKTTSSWKSHRDGLRNDILGAGLAVVFILWMITGALFYLLSSNTRSPSSYSPSCPVSSPRWPNC